MTIVKNFDCFLNLLILYNYNVGMKLNANLTRFHTYTFILIRWSFKQVQ